MPMQRRTGDSVPGRRKSRRSTSCSQGIDWVAVEDVEAQRASERFKPDGENKTECLLPKTVNSSKRRQTWSQEEDEILIQLVNLHSPIKWSTIACSMPGRSRQQCRERWMFNLDPAVNKQPWSEQEEITLIHAHQIHGNKWSELAKLFPGRTGKAVKNHWACLKNKKVRSHLVKGSPDQLPHSTDKSSVQDSPTNIHVSSEMPVSLELEQALTGGSGRSASTLNRKTSDRSITQGKWSVPHSVNVSQKVGVQITTSSSHLVTEEHSADRKIVGFPMSQQEEMTDSMAFRRNSGSTDFSPARSLLVSGSGHSDEICCSAGSESREQRLPNLADLLDMPYCNSLMIIPPGSPSPDDEP